jgi:hypothetical protein
MWIIRSIEAQEVKTISLTYKAAFRILIPCKSKFLSIIINKMNRFSGRA